MPKSNDRIGSYQLIRKLGEGGFGEVWLALDSSGSGSHEVAVKMPLKSEIDFDSLLQEATLWARATGHANVLEFLAARVFDGQIVLVSEFAPDGSLNDWLKRHGGRAPSIEAAVQMTLGILAGLEHLHGRNIIHRDVKPDNVLLQGVTPRLADFGISRVLKTTSHTVEGAGTPAFMAPEAFNRKRNQQTDLWSIGVMLYQMLAGRLPFDGADITELYGAILTEEPDPLPAEVHKWLRQVVAKALTKDPKQRFKTAAEMRTALTPQPPSEPKPIVIKPEPKPIRQTGLRPAIKWSGAGLAAIVLAVATYVATKTTTIVSPDSFDSPVKTLPNLGEEFTENLNGVKLEMKRVPGGVFLMGSPENESVYSKDEGPQHRVTVSSFYIGKYEVTQAQWKAVMGGKNPSNFKGDDLPVENISWDDAKAFCQKLSQMTGKTYRLPSEAEWEYACRAGTIGQYAGDPNAKLRFGNSEIDLFMAERRDLMEMAWFKENSRRKTHPVGQKKPNRFGLFDMHGNVWEWCEDVWHDSYGGQHGTPPADGNAWLTGGDQNARVLRGGSWRPSFDDIARFVDEQAKSGTHSSSQDSLRSATRYEGTLGDRSSDMGVRVVLSSSTLHSQNPGK